MTVSIEPWELHGHAARVEVWLTVVGYAGYYEVSDRGQVRSVPRVIEYADHRVRFYPECVLAQTPSSDGRLGVGLSVENLVRRRPVHQLVLEAFVGPRPDELVGCHNDGVFTHNWPGNLRWDTQSSNMFDKTLHGTDHYRNRERDPLGHLLVSPNLRAADLRLGHRACKACNRAMADRQRARARGQYFDLSVAADRHYDRIMIGMVER
ncbi:MAG: NUMOD4 domain-containing protein [Candidatus Dormibacteria bacterium]